MPLVRTMIYILLAAVLASAVLFGLWLDVHVLQDKLGEISVTETLQAGMLAMIIVIHFKLVNDSAFMRNCNLLIGGFFLAMLIRELDGLFDLISHGSWVWFALFSSIIVIAYTARQHRRTLAELSRYPLTPYYGMMISGLLCILVFSRLFGMHSLWESVLGDEYLRVVKNMVEEGAESFGYTLCLTSSIAYYFYQLRSERSLNEQPPTVS
ncbi:transporter [Scandinavium sp. TWS1a]|uniref:transporter n=1 Tax=Scandinavium tedordense TaxID=2926521 RepID=UPI002165EDFF|nr:transporter [Scandinavium tedordense]MCS2169261.1 transporter [Scandinavium tedordense]